MTFLFWITWYLILIQTCDLRSELEKDLFSYFPFFISRVIFFNIQNKTSIWNYQKLMCKTFICKKKTIFIEAFMSYESNTSQYILHFAILIEMLSLIWSSSFVRSLHDTKICAVITSYITLCPPLHIYFKKQTIIFNSNQSINFKQEPKCNYKNLPC